MEHRPISKILVELDAILDTRLPTLGKINPTAAVRASQDPRYFDRVIDDFSSICEIDKTMFREQYAARNNDTVKASVITEIPFILHDLVLKLEQDTIDTPFISRVVVEVNVFPYEFDESDSMTIELAVMARCGVETEVKCVRYTPQQLTPSFIREQYSGLILYNFRDWMQHHLVEFGQVKMPRVSVLAPALYYDVVPSKSEFQKEGIVETIDAFQLSEVGTIELFALSLLPAANYSMARIPGHYKSKEPSPADALQDFLPEEIKLK